MTKRCPRPGSIPGWTARPEAPPTGFPGCSAQSTAGTASVTHLWVRRGVPSPTPSFFFPSDKAFSGSFSWSCSLSASTNLKEIKERYRLLDRREVDGRSSLRGQAWGPELRNEMLKNKQNKTKQNKRWTILNWSDLPPKITFPFKAMQAHY